MTIFINSSRGNAKDTSYPIKKVISSVEELREAAAFDHVGCEFRDGKNNRGTVVRFYRNKKCFVSADVVIMDCDNTSSDPTKDLPKEEWKTPKDVEKCFPGVPFYVVYSRNNEKEKNGLPARPKFHIYFPLSREIKDAGALEKLKSEVLFFFPSFDPAAVAVTQMMFGVDEPKVEEYKGNVKIDQWIEKETKLPEVIPEGERNETLSAFAGKIITRYGDTDKAKEIFLEAAERCTPSLEDNELETIWRSAQSFFKEKVNDGTWKTPAEYEFGKDKGFTIEDLERLLKKMGIKMHLNDITGKTEVSGLKGVKKGYAANALPGQIRSYMNEKGIHCSRGDLDDFLTNILSRNSFNPVKALLTSTTWDGEDRVKELLEIMGITEEREVILVKKWLHQTVAMALNDDEKPYAADGVLVLQGPQGSGKTLLCRKLAMHHDWFGEGMCIDVNNKDSLIQSTSHWIVELGELDSTLKKDQSSLKAFLSNRSDEIRVPYARAAVTRPRRTSFCATVNPATFLIDETGSRRFWVVRPQIDVERVLKLDEPWLRQMWTQVYTTMYKENPQGFRLTKEEMDDLQAHNEVYARPLPGEIEILDQLNFAVPDKAWVWTTASRLARETSLKYLSAVQVGRVLSKLSKLDPRIQTKKFHNTTQYLLPPKREYEVYPDDDDRPVLSVSVPSWWEPEWAADLRAVLPEDEFAAVVEMLS